MERITKWLLINPCAYIVVGGILIISDLGNSYLLNFTGIRGLVGLSMIAIIMPIVGYIWEKRYETHQI